MISSFHSTHHSIQHKNGFVIFILDLLIIGEVERQLVFFT